MLVASVNTAEARAVEARARANPGRRRGDSPDPAAAAHATATRTAAAHMTATHAAAPAAATKAATRARGNPMISSALATGACVALVLSFLAINAAVMASGYELARAEKALGLARTEYDRLKLEAFELTSLKRVEAEARGRLGMVDPDEVQYVVVAPVTQHGMAADAGTGKGVADAVDGKGSMIGYAASLGGRMREAVFGLMSPFVARWFGGQQPTP